MVDKMKSLLSEQEIDGAQRVLFMSHLALGDFVYHGALLKSLKHKYPHLTIDIWMDDCRDRPKSWHKDRSDTLESWISRTGIAEVIFPIAKGNDDRDTLIRRANCRNYDIIFYLASARSNKFAQVAHAISKKAILVGNNPQKLVDKLKGYRHFRHVNRRFCCNLHDDKTHVLKEYKLYYEKCFGPLELIAEDQFGLGISLPQPSINAADAWLTLDIKKTFAHTVLINPISTSRKRDLDSNALKLLLETLLTEYPSIHIIISAPPSSKVGMNAMLKHFDIRCNKTQLVSVFSASDDFYMLPAIMQRCDFVITVETSIMHIAATMGLPQMAIVRRKAQKWQPLRANDIFWCDGDIRDCSDTKVVSRALSNIQKALALKAC